MRGLSMRLVLISCGIWGLQPLGCTLLGTVVRQLRPPALPCRQLHGEGKGRLWSHRHKERERGVRAGRRVGPDLPGNAEPCSHPHQATRVVEGSDRHTSPAARRVKLTRAASERAYLQRCCLAHSRTWRIHCVLRMRNRSSKKRVATSAVSGARAELEAVST